MFTRSAIPYPQDQRWVRWMMILIFLLGMLLALKPPVTAWAADEIPCVQYYTVQKNDTLNSIARKFSVKFNELVQANKLKEPYTIFVGQRLCIPKTSKVGPVGIGDWGTTDALYFTVRYTAKGFVITAVNFPPKSHFLVKIDDLAVPGIEWVKIGKLKVKKTGQVEVAFELPEALRSATFLHICLKNQINDGLFCKYSLRYIP